jgi:hypothetical protein
VHLHAELAADDVDRRLAGPKAVEPAVRLRVFRREAISLRHALGRHLHLHAALQLAGALDGNLHVKPLMIDCVSMNARVVRKARLELARVTPLDSKSSASTNSATLASE